MAKKYKLNANGIKDNETGSFIPNEMGNRDWVEYQEWLSKGNTPDPEYNLDELKNKLKDKISALKTKKSSRVLYNNNFWFQTDEKSLTKISGKVLGFIVSQTWPSNFYWTAEDNSNISFMTGQEFILFAKATEDHQLKCHYNSQKLKASVSVCTTEEELNAVDINVGWPW